MRRDSIFWGGSLILLGGLFFLQARGLIENVWGMFWPLFLMMLGLLILSAPLFPGKAQMGEVKSLVALDDSAREARIKFDFGASSLKVAGNAQPNSLVYGTSGTVLNVKSHTSGDVQIVGLEGGPSFLPFLGSASGEWHFDLSNELPLEMEAHAGASTLTFDLSDLNVRSFKVEAGASTINITAPRSGESRIRVEAGAATINLDVPAGVEACVRTDGFMTMNVDQSRYTLRGNVYETAGYVDASQRVEIELNGGANTVYVK